jgi:voltage-gated potassium channel
MFVGQEEKLLRREMYRDIKRLHEEISVLHEELRGLRKAVSRNDPAPPENHHIAHE